MMIPRTIKGLGCCYRNLREDTAEFRNFQGILLELAVIKHPGSTPLIGSKIEDMKNIKLQMPIDQITKLYFLMGLAAKQSVLQRKGTSQFHFQFKIGFDKILLERRC